MSDAGRFTASTDVLAELLRPQILHDPWPLYSWLRDNDPVHRTASGVYLLSRHFDTEWLTREYQLFRPATPADGPAKSRSAAMLAETIPSTAPPVHTRLRRLIARDFTPRRVQRLTESTERVCDQSLADLVEPLHDGAVVNAHDVSLQLPARVFLALLGLPQADWRWLSTAVPVVLAGLTPTATADVIANSDKTTEEMETYFLRAAAARRENPKDDLLTALVSTHDGDPDRLSKDELGVMLWSLVLAGFLSTTSGLDHAILAVLTNPDHNHWLTGDPARTASYVEEVLRWGSPSVMNAVARITVNDLEVAGVTVPAGSDLRMLAGSANHDPAVFPDPERFDPTRNSRIQMTFGGGIHYCLGAHLVRMQTAVLLRRLRLRLPDLALAGTPTRRPNLSLRMVDDLPVALAGVA
jgi:cytochrome P450